jgi:hypothetical protein
MLLLLHGLHIPAFYMGPTPHGGPKAGETLLITIRGSSCIAPRRQGTRAYSLLDVITSQKSIPISLGDLISVDLIFVFEHMLVAQLPF